MKESTNEFDWEMAAAEEAGGLAKYELINQRETEARARPAKAQPAAPAPAVELPRVRMGNRYQSLSLLEDEDRRQVSAIFKADRVPDEAKTFAAAIQHREKSGRPVISRAERDYLRRLVTRHWRAVSRAMRPKREPKIRTQAFDLCEYWGMWETGGRLQSVSLNPRQPVAEEGVDEAEHAHFYVETTAEFDTARPALLHTFGYGMPPSRMNYRGYGEPLGVALARLGWYEFLGRKEREIPALVIRRFLRTLVWRLEEDPFVLPTPVEDETPEQANEAMRQASKWPKGGLSK